MTHCSISIANYYQMKASIFSATINSKDAFKKAEQYLDFALKLDKDWHFNFIIKGFQLTFFHWNFKDAHKNYKKGLKASKPLSYIMYRDFLQLENRHKKGLEIALKISKETPFYPNAPLIMSYYYNNMYKEGEAYIKERLEAFPTHYLMYDNAGFFMLNTGNYKKAIRLFKQLIKKENKILPRAFGWMAAAYAHSGNTEKAIEILNKLKAIKKKTHAGSPAWFIAVIYAALGKKTDALAWISVAIKAQELEVPWLVSEPQFYFLHGTTEFNTLVKKVGFSKHAYPVKLPKHQIISLNNG